MKLPPHLVYTSDEDLTICRKPWGKGFTYIDANGNRVTSTEEKGRYAELAVPPAYREVRFCKKRNGHLQATGLDEKGRKQYRYHPDWTDWTNQQKFEGLLEFGLALPKLRGAMAYALKKEGLSRPRILAAVVKLLDRTAARIGNETYYEENGTVGLTTLRKKHVELDSHQIHLEYVAKGGKEREFDLNHPTLAKIIARMEDLPGQRLFQYRDGKKVHPVSSTDVNEWLKEKSGLEEISAKDFRTWHASRLTLSDLLSQEPKDSQSARIRQQTAVLKNTSAILGHRPPVCKKHYIHPKILELHRKGSLEVTTNIKSIESDLKPYPEEEKILIQFLREISDEN